MATDAGASVFHSPYGKRDSCGKVPRRERTRPQAAGRGEQLERNRNPLQNWVGKTQRYPTLVSRSSEPLLGGVVMDDATIFNTKLQEWECFCNFERPNGALDGLTDL